MRVRLLPALAAACCIVATFACAAGAEDRTSRRSAEMALPDPYLDPAWPDKAGDEMEGRYAPGKSDSVEDAPLDEEREMQEEQRALEESTGASAPTAPAPARAIVPGSPAVDESGNELEQAPDQQIGSDDTGDDVEDAPDMEERDPVEW